MFEDINFHRAAVADHIAKSFINDFGSEEDLEKAHKVGDVHPNGKWVWKEYAPGKFDWRGIKGGSSSGGASAAPAPMKPVSKPQGQQSNKPAASDNSKNPTSIVDQISYLKNSINAVQKFVIDLNRDIVHCRSEYETARKAKDYGMKTYYKNRLEANKKVLDERKKQLADYKKRISDLKLKQTHQFQAQPKQPQAAPSQQSAQTAAKKKDSNIIGSITKNGNRFSFNLDGKEYDFDTRTKAMEVLSLVKNMKDGKSIHDALNYLYKNYPNPVAYYAKNHLTNLGYVGLHDISGNYQEQRAHKFDPINAVLNTTRNVMKGKKPLTSFLPIPSNLGNDIKTEYYQFSNKTPEELTKLENIYKRKVQNPTISDSSKKFAEKQLKVLKIFTDALGKFYSQWDN